MNVLRWLSLPISITLISAVFVACGSKSSYTDTQPTHISEHYGAIDNEIIVQAHDVTVYQRSDETAVIGQGFPICLRVESHCSAAAVKVISTFNPEEAELIKTEPAAEVNGDEITWEWDYMRAGDCENLTIWLKPKSDGDLVVCTALQVLPMGCICVNCGCPELAITKCGPERVALGCEACYDIEVSNIGTQSAQEVFLKDYVPEGFCHESGKQVIGYHIGTLCPGESRHIPLTFSAIKRGPWCNRAVAESCNCPPVSADACTEVFCHEIALIKTGPETQFHGKSANYQITVTNPGDARLTEVTVVDYAPENTYIRSAKDAATTDHSATWNVGDLEPGESKTLYITLCSDCLGTTCNVAEVSSCEGCTDRAHACTEWLGRSALLMEVIDCEDPLLLGCETCWKIRATNQGTAADHNISIVVNFPQGLQPKEAEGPTQGNIEGQRIYFDPLITLDCKQTAEWTVCARAVALGDHRVRVEMSSETLQEPVVEEESTQVY